MKRPIIIIILIILLLYTPYMNYKYKKFYNKVPEEVNLEAVVISNVQVGKHYNSYTLKGKNNLYKNKKFIVYTKEELSYGDKVVATGEFHEPEEQRNYKGFNFKKYLQTKKIYGSIKAKSIKIISKNNINIFLRLSNLTRNIIIKNIGKILPQETSELLIGLLLGDKTNIEEEVINNFQKSSLAHILAVSGAHVSYIILGITSFININKTPKKGGYIFIIFVLIVFIFLTNFSLSVIRACIMAIVLIISKLLHRKADIINTMGIALLITIIYNPYTIRSVSLQLSYLGTAGVIFLSPIIENLPKKLKINTKYSKILSVPIAAQISILPIMIINFHTISFTFLVSNVIAIPFFGIAIIGGFILVIISFFWMFCAQKVGIIIHVVLKILILIARFCANLKLSNIYIITPNTITVLLYYFFLFTIIYLFNLKKGSNLNKYEMYILNLFSKISPKKILAVILIAVCLIEFPYVYFNRKLKIYFIDVGQRR